MGFDAAVECVRSLNDVAERAVHVGGANEPAALTAREVVALTTLLLHAVAAKGAPVELQRFGGCR